MKKEWLGSLGVLGFILAFSLWAYQFEQTGLALSPPYEGPSEPTCWEKTAPTKPALPGICPDLAYQSYQDCQQCCDDRYPTKDPFTPTGSHANCVNDCLSQYKKWEDKNCPPDEEEITKRQRVLDWLYGRASNR